MNDSRRLTRLRRGRPRPRQAACRAQAVPALTGGAPSKPLGSPKGTGLPRSGVGTAVEGLRPPRRSHRVVSPGSAQGPVSGLRLPHPGLSLRVLLCSEWGGAHRRKMGGLSHPPLICARGSPPRAPTCSRHVGTKARSWLLPAPPLCPRSPAQRRPEWARQDPHRPPPEMF